MWPNMFTMYTMLEKFDWILDHIMAYSKYAVTIWILFNEEWNMKQWYYCYCFLAIGLSIFINVSFGYITENHSKLYFIFTNILLKRLILIWLSDFIDIHHHRIWTSVNKWFRWTFILFIFILCRWRVSSMWLQYS